MVGCLFVKWKRLLVGLDETMDENMINQGPQFIAYMTEELLKKGVPVVTPAGGLGCHINAMEFVDHIPQTEYPAGALSSGPISCRWCTWDGKRHDV